MKNNFYIPKVLLLLCVAFFLGNTTDVQAEKSEKYQALFIAIDNYNSKVWSPLKNPVNDANTIQDVLKSKYGFSRVSTLYNQEATRAKILETLENKVNQLSEDDNFVIYFSGHGIELGEEGYWVPVEAKSQERYELLSITEIKNIISKSACKHILIMVDACFSSTILKAPSRKSNNNSDAYYEEVGNLVSRQAITAGGLEPVSDGLGDHSVFAKYVLKFLNNNEQNILDASELYELIKYPVAANSPNTPQFGHLQNTGHEGGQFLFRLIKEKLCNSPVYFEEGEVVTFDKDGGTLHAKTEFKNVRYEWSHNSELLDHEGPNLPITKSGMYGVTIIMEDGDCSNSAIAEVEIVMPEVVIDILEGKKAAFTYKGNLNATITGYTGEVVYEWKKGNFIISNESTIEVMESDDYTITVRLPDGRELGRQTTFVEIKNRIYVIQMGDNIERIARKFYNDADKANLIYAANPSVKPGKVLRVGSNLIIPSTQAEASVLPISIGTTQSFAPFSQKSLYNGGMLTDIVNTVYTSMGRKTDITYVPNNQLKGISFNGRTEVSYPMTNNANNRMLFLFSEPLYTTVTVFFSAKDSEVTDVESTMKKRMKKGTYRKLVVALPVGFTSDKLLEYYKDKKIVLKPMASLEACFQAMAEGKVDLVAAIQISALVTLQNSVSLNRADFKILDKSIESTTLHLVVSKEHPQAKEIITNFNTALAKAKEEGKVGKIVDKHIDLIQNEKP